MAANQNDKARKSYSYLQKSLNGGIGSGDTTIALNNTTNVPTDTAVDFVIDRVDSNGTKTTNGTRELCKGVVSGSNIINVTRGLHGTTAQSHINGAVVEFVASGAAWNDQIDFLLQDHSNPSGYHKTLSDANGNEWIKQTATTSAVNEFTVANAATGNGPTLSATGDDSNVDINLTPKGTGVIKLNGPLDLNSQTIKNYNGWLSSILPAYSSATYNGNHSTDVTFASSVASYLTPGMRLRFTRTVAAPTQCTSLNGSSQYWVKTSPNKLTFTDDFVVSAWVKLASYPSAGNTTTIASRYNGTSGWQMIVLNTGKIEFDGFNNGATNFSNITSGGSLPLNKWVHVTAQLDMSAYSATTTTSYIMFDGVDIPSVVARGGTNPTSLIQAGNLEIGSTNGGINSFNGKIAQVAIFNAKVTQATIRTYISQGLSGSETSIASAYSFNGVATDLNSTTPNDLSVGGGSAVATNADSPFSVDATDTVGSYDYGIVTKVASAVATVQTPEANAIPTSGGVSAVDYSAWKVPFNFPAEPSKWTVTYADTGNQTASGSTTWTNTGTLKITLPIGSWMVYYSGNLQNGRSQANTGSAKATLSTANNSESNALFTSQIGDMSATGATATQIGMPVYKRLSITAASATDYFLNCWSAATSTRGFRGDLQTTIIEAACAYL